DDPTDSRELAMELLARGVKQLVLTRGSQGATLVESSGNVTHFPAIPAKVADTTGAGDAFNAALAVVLGEGRSLTDAVRFALHGGAYACTRLGVIPALPHRNNMPQWPATSGTILQCVEGCWHSQL